jgi:hypothetical protein
VCDDGEREALVRAAEIMFRMVEYGGGVAPREP